MRKVLRLFKIPAAPGAQPAEGFKAVDGVVSAACAGGPWAKAWPWAGVCGGDQCLET